MNSTFAIPVRLPGLPGKSTRYVFAQPGPPARAQDPFRMRAGSGASDYRRARGTDTSSARAAGARVEAGNRGRRP
jgi:hypothetical protein